MWVIKAFKTLKPNWILIKKVNGDNKKNPNYQFNADVIFSCSKDEESIADPIIGTWDKYGDGDSVYVIEINSNGTFEAVNGKSGSWLNISEQQNLSSKTQKYRWSDDEEPTFEFDATFDEDLDAFDYFIDGTFLFIRY